MVYLTPTPIPQLFSPMLFNFYFHIVTYEHSHPSKIIISKLTQLSSVSYQAYLSFMLNARKYKALSWANSWLHSFEVKYQRSESNEPWVDYES